MTLPNKIGITVLDDKPTRLRDSRGFWVAVLCYVVVFAMMGSFLMGTQFDPASDEEPWQAAMHMSNWTNRTLEIDLYVFGGDTLQYSFTLDHEENITLTLTWLDVKNTLIFAHSIGEDIDNWSVYEIEPGEWRSVILW